MKRKLFWLFAVGLCVLPAAADELPNNIYFQAMQDEMTRSLSKLRVKGSPKPYYLAYQLNYDHVYCAGASLGELNEGKDSVSHVLSASVAVAAGNGQNDSMGFMNDRFSYMPERGYDVPNSYWGIRHVLWSLTDDGYVKAADSYEKKQTYKRQKNMIEQYPDFSKAPQASFVEPIAGFPKPPAEQMQQWVKTLSAQGKEVPYLENFSVRICFSQRDNYYLNSAGGHYQFSSPKSWLSVAANLRNREGYKEIISRNIPLPEDHSLIPAELQKQTDQVLQSARQLFEAQKPEPYLGPVLLTPRAAADFLNELLVQNVRNVTPLLSFLFENDPSAGSFRNKAGMRIMSNVADIYDKPLLRRYKGLPLGGFMPVDDEGVKAQNLTVVSAGRLQQLPLSRRSGGTGQNSNGHARMSFSTLPREALSNIVVQPKNPLSSEEMEQKLLDRCRELELEYCYILQEFPQEKRPTVNLAERIYTKDGHREPVFGIKIGEKTTRSLRDILAAGQEDTVTSFQDPESREYALIAPSLLVDEIEIVPDDKKPDRKPFTPKP